MTKIRMGVLFCVLGVAACSKHEPTDAQLMTLLQADHGVAASVKKLDAGAVTCLRAWSGDAELTSGLATGQVSEDGKKTCRVRIDQWIADSERNPEHFAFDDIAVPSVVRRVFAMQKAEQVAMLKGNEQVPPGLMAPAPAPVVKMRAPNPNVDLGAAGAKLEEAETLCTQVQQAAVGAAPGSGVVRFGAYCAGALGKLRGAMEGVASGGEMSKLDMMEQNAENLSNTARKVLASAEKQKQK